MAKQYSVICRFYDLLTDYLLLKIWAKIDIVKSWQAYLIISLEQFLEVLNYWINQYYIVKNLN